MTAAAHTRPAPAAAAAVAAVAEAIRAHRFRYSDERQLQDALGGALTAAGFDVAREVSLDAASRIDLLAGSIGVEVKVAGTLESVTRQLCRYVTHDQIDGLVLVTTRVRHRQVPATIAGKPVAVVCLAEAGL